jgi:hypothetical protein
MNTNLISKRRALYICPGWELWSSVINELEVKYLIAPSAVISHNSHFMEKKITNKDCLLVDEKKFREGEECENNNALDEKILKLIAPYKNITIKMMERYYFGEFINNSTNQVILYHKLVKYAYSMFIKIDPDMVISASPPHRVYDYLIKQFCIVHNKKFLCFEHTNIPFLSYFKSSLERDFPYSRGKKGLLPTSNELNDFLDKTKSNCYEDVKPVYSGQKSFFKDKKRNKDKKNYIYSLVKKLLKFRVRLLIKPVVGRFIVNYDSYSLHVKYSKMIGMIFQKIMRILSLNIVCMPYYNFFSKKNIYNKVSYIYFSPNYQPERSTVPDGSIFWDFNLAIDLLHSSLPDGWKILYKEHPRAFKKNTDWDIDRNIFFYLRLRFKYPNLIFINKGEDVLTLIDSSKAVAAVNGTSLWESVIRRKPVILFGEQWLENMPGVTHINSPSQCYEILNMINQDNFKNSDKENVHDYFSLLESSCDDLSSYLDYARETRASSDVNNRLKDNKQFNMDEIITKLVKSIIAAC